MLTGVAAPGKRPARDGDDRNFRRAMKEYLRGSEGGFILVDKCCFDLQSVSATRFSCATRIGKRSRTDTPNVELTDFHPANIRVYGSLREIN